MVGLAPAIGPGPLLDLIRLEAEQVPQGIARSRRDLRQHDEGDGPADDLQAVHAILDRRDLGLTEQRPRVPRGHGIQPEVCGRCLGSVGLAVVDVMPDQFFDRPGVQALLPGLVGHKVVRTQRIQPVAGVG